VSCAPKDGKAGASRRRVQLLSRPTFDALRVTSDTLDTRLPINGRTQQSDRQDCHAGVEQNPSKKFNPKSND
jgi:hypothetical protein